MRRILPCLLAAGAVLALVATSAAQKPPKPPGQQGVTLQPSATLLQRPLGKLGRTLERVKTTDSDGEDTGIPS